MQQLVLPMVHLVLGFFFANHTKQPRATSLFQVPSNNLNWVRTVYEPGPIEDLSHTEMRVGDGWESGQKQDLEICAIFSESAGWTVLPPHHTGALLPTTEANSLLQIPMNFP